MYIKSFACAERRIGCAGGSPGNCLWTCDKEGDLVVLKVDLSELKGDLPVPKEDLVVLHVEEDFTVQERDFVVLHAYRWSRIKNGYLYI